MDRRSAPVFVRVLAWVVSALVLVVLDGVATISDAQARQGVTVALVKFFGQG